MKIFGHPKRDFFTSKAWLYLEICGQKDKITPEAGKKQAPFLHKNHTFQGSNGLMSVQSSKIDIQFKIMTLGPLLFLS